MPKGFDVYLSPELHATQRRRLQQPMRRLPEPIIHQLVEYMKRRDTAYFLARPVSTILVDMLEEAGVERDEALKMADDLLGA